MHPTLLARLERDISDLLVIYPELAEDETLRADMLEGSTEIDDILTALVKERIAMDAMAAGIHLAIEEMRERSARFDRKAEAYEGMLRRIMDAAGLKKKVLPIATLSMSKARDKITVTDEGLLPAAYWRIPAPQVDKTAINTAIKNGLDVPGVSVDSNQPMQLTIRTK
jgi:hypothetical protein